MVRKKETLEQRVRELDNEKIHVAKMARIIARQLGANERSIEQFLGAKRKEYESLYTMSLEKYGAEELARKNEERVRKNGYEDMTHYVGVRRVLRSEKLGTSLKQHEFENSMERLGRQAEEQIDYFISGEEGVDLHDALDWLPAKDRDQIYRLYFENNTFKELGSSDGGVTRQAAQIRASQVMDVLRSLYDAPQPYPGRIIYTSEELLCAHVLLKSDISDNEFAQTLNTLFHDRKRYRTSESIRYLRYKPHKEKREEVSERYIGSDKYRGGEDNAKS